MVQLFEELPAEIRFMVMHHAPDLLTLLNLSSVYPDLALELQRTSEVLIPAVISRSMSTELEKLANAIVTLHAQPLRVHADLDSQTRRIDISGLHADWSTHVLTNLKILVEIQGTIDFFVHGFVQTQGHPVGGQCSTPFTETELYRIHRAFWRFELCCELYQSTTATDGYEKHGKFREVRINRQYIFLRTLTPWEAEELECVYDYLERLFLGNANVDQDLECSDVDICVDLQATILPTAGNKRSRGTESRFLSKGLVFLRRYLTMSGTDRVSQLEEDESCRHMFVRPVLSQCRVYLSMAPERLQQLITGQIPHSTWNSGDSDISLPNVGWRYFTPDVPLDRIVERKQFKYLRRWGFCIWDQERLESWGVLSKRYSDDVEMLFNNSLFKNVLEECRRLGNVLWAGYMRDSCKCRTPDCQCSNGLELSPDPFRFPRGVSHHYEIPIHRT